MSQTSSVAETLLAILKISPLRAIVVCRQISAGPSQPKSNTSRNLQLRAQATLRELLRLNVTSKAAGNARESGELFEMPYYSFDLVIGEECRNQGGLILEDLDVASDRAQQLATELCIVLPELKTKGCAVRVTDGDSRELYRTPLDPIPAWVKRQLL